MHEVLFQRYPSLHDIKFIGVKPILYKNVILPKGGKQGIETSLSSPTSTFFNFLQEYSAALFTPACYFPREIYMGK